MLSVLVVDDERDLLDLVHHFLERYGEMKVETTASTKEALAMAGKTAYDAIVIDYCMPEITGLEFLKILRAKGDSTPVIIFTGVGREHAAIEALNNGADFFLQKGEDPKAQLRDLAHMIRQAQERRSVGRSLGTSQRIIADIMGFSQDAMLAIDREGTVIAWNAAMEELSGVPAGLMVGKDNYACSEPFFGRKQKMLIDLIFETDEEIRKNRYVLVSRIKKGPVVAVAQAASPDSGKRTLWMKAMPLFDVRGDFIASISAIRDITGTMMEPPLPDPEAGSPAPDATAATAASPPAAGGGLIDRILGRAGAAYREGVRLYCREMKYRDAIAAFDRAIAIDPSLAHAWNDRGLCYRELGEYDSALESFFHALELAPRNAEILHDLGETLETVGVMHRDVRYLDAALQSFNTLATVAPDSAGTWNHIGVCLKEMGRPEEARIYFERARDIALWKKDMSIPRKRDEVL